MATPADAIETEAAVKSLIADPGPAYLRLERIPVNTVNNHPGYRFELGKGTVLAEGGDLTIISNGLMVQPVLEVAEQLRKENITVRVINMHTVKPIDRELIIKAARETGAIVTVENHNIIGGLGSAVAEVLSENCAVAFKRIGVNDSFGKSGTFADIMAKYGLDRDGITARIMELLKGKQSW